MNPYCLEDIQSEIEILQIKRKKAINKYNAYLCTRNAFSKIVHDKKEKELGCPIKKVHDIRVEFDRVTVECDFINQAGKEVRGCEKAYPWPLQRKPARECSPWRDTETGCRHGALQ